MSAKIFMYIYTLKTCIKHAQYLVNGTILQAITKLAKINACQALRCVPCILSNRAQSIVQVKSWVEHNFNHNIDIKGDALSVEYR